MLWTTKVAGCGLGGVGHAAQGRYDVQIEEKHLPQHSREFAVPEATAQDSGQGERPTRKTEHILWTPPVLLVPDGLVRLGSKFKKHEKNF